MEKSQKVDKEDKNKEGLLLDCYTYKSTFPGLFSFRNLKEIKFDTLFLQESEYIMRDENNVKKHGQHGDSNGSEEYICKVNINKENFELTRPITLDMHRIKNNLWYMINPTKNLKESEISVKNEDYYLCEGDIIKLADHLYLIREIHIENDSMKENSNNSKNIYDIHSLNFNHKEIIINTSYDPNILDETNYCSHIVDELKNGENSKNWEDIQYNKRYIDIYGVKRYIFTMKYCIKCNKFYPLRFRLNEKSEIIDLAKLDIPENNNYMIIESIEEIKEKEDENENNRNNENEYESKGYEEIYEKYFYVIELYEGKEIIIGRDNKERGVDVIVNPKYQNISKKHAVIKYLKDEGKILLQDICNHCGTMVLIKEKNLQIKKEKEIYLLSGRTFFMAKICNKEEYERVKEEKERLKRIQKKKQEDNEKIEENENENEIVNGIYG